MYKPVWKKFYDEKLKDIAMADVVYDIGGASGVLDRQRFKKLIVLDVNESYGPDIVADVQNLPFENDSIEAVVCFSVLEHVPDPKKGVEEIHRSLRMGGKALVTVPFLWPYHANPPLYMDYWRFSRDALNELFKGFSVVEIIPMGGYLSSLANQIPSFTKIDRLLRPVAQWLDEKVIGIRNATPAFVVYASK